MKLLSPKTYIDAASLGLPIFYLAGPIRGGGGWQINAFRMLGEFEGDRLVADPTRYNASHEFIQYRVRGVESHFSRQTDWEDYYMKLAAQGGQGGCLIFWLPTESSLKPRPPYEGPYAQDTYGELGYWRARMEYARRLSPDGRHNLRIVVGADSGFFGLKKIARDFCRAVDYEFPICESLRETIHRAVEVVNKG